MRDMPTVKDLAADLRGLKRSLSSLVPDGEDPAIEVRLQVVDGEGWRLWDGDPSYDTDHRGAWGCGTVDAATNCRELARDLIAEVRGQVD